MAASSVRNTEGVQLLQEHNANRDLAANSGATALTFASDSKSLEIVQLLITHGKKENPIGHTKP